MNTTTETTRNTNSVFETKEQYIAFRTKWKELHATGFHKRVRQEYKGGYDWRTKSNHPDGYRMESPLTVWHHLIFNLAIGRNPPVKAFGDRTERKETHSWNKPPLYYTIRYGSSHSFDAFGDSLTVEQRATLTKAVDDFVFKL